MQTLILLIEYDGINYSGWQIQPNARSVQEEIEKAVSKLFGESIKIIGSGRTDAGVHSKGQVASATINQQVIPEEKLKIAINSELPEDIKILNAVYFEGKFDARRDAISRVYEYFIGWDISVFERYYVTNSKKPLNLNLLNQAAQIFIGKHDFTTFSKINPDIKNNVCTIHQSSWEKVSETKLKFTVEANHFLYGMVRALVGSMLDFERGKYSLDYLIDCLDNPDRSKYIYFAPSNGLYLTRVHYKETIEQKLYR